ncbi:MAG: hypothetical protein ACRDV6_06560 [Acidimicrobiales bacterium]
MTLTELRPITPSAPPTDSGWGGNGWDDQDPGDGGGWGDDPHGDDETPYERPKVVRGVALATAIAVITGSIGGWVAILAGGPTTTVGVSMAMIDNSAVGTSPATAVVSFMATNELIDATRATCRATVSSGTETMGSATVRIRLDGATRAPQAMSVPLPRGFGTVVPSVRVTCSALTTERT